MRVRSTAACKEALRLQIVGEILGRRKLKRGYEYEVNWKGQPMDKNEWLTRDQLEEMGWGKTLNDIDIKEAAKQGLVSRPLTGQSTLDRPTLPHSRVLVPQDSLHLKLHMSDPSQAAEDIYSAEAKCFVPRL